MTSCEGFSGFDDAPTMAMVFASDNILNISLSEGLPGQRPPVSSLKSLPAMIVPSLYIFLYAAQYPTISRRGQLALSQIGKLEGGQGRRRRAAVVGHFGRQVYPAFRRDCAGGGV